MAKKGEIIKAAIVHVTYVIYYITLFTRLGLILEKFPGDYKRDGTIAAGVVVSFVFIVAQIALFIFAVFPKYRIEPLVNQTWVNVPMLCFIIFSIGPYGMALQHQYKDPELSAKLPYASNTTTADEKSCFSVSKI